MQRLLDYMTKPWSARWVGTLILITVAVVPVIAYACDGFLPDGRYISGYYCDAVRLGLLVPLLAVYVALIIASHLRRQAAQMACRLAGLFAVLAAAVVIWVLSPAYAPLPSRAWRVASLHSPARNQSYVLVNARLILSDELQIYRMNGTRLNPIWELPFDDLWCKGPPEGYFSELRLVLSDDERFLGVARGEYVTDVIHLDTGRPLVRTVYPEKDVMPIRSVYAERLLTSHVPLNGPAAEAMSEDDIQAALDAYCERLQFVMQQELGPELQVKTCEVRLGKIYRGRVTARLAVTYTIGQRADAHSRPMLFLVDAGRLLLVASDEMWGGYYAAPEDFPDTPQMGAILCAAVDLSGDGN